MGRSQTRAKTKARQAEKPSLMRLPPLWPPVERRISTRPWVTEIAASRPGCLECLASCGRLGGPLQPICEALCAQYCGR